LMGLCLSALFFMVEIFYNRVLCKRTWRLWWVWFYVIFKYGSVYRELLNLQLLL
jgi:hypothetical protein